jgi:hypothetical protein
LITIHSFLRLSRQAGPWVLRAISLLRFPFFVLIQQHAHQQFSLNLADRSLRSLLPVRADQLHNFLLSRAVSVMYHLLDEAGCLLTKPVDLHCLVQSSIVLHRAKALAHAILALRLVAKFAIPKSIYFLVYIFYFQILFSIVIFFYILCKHLII